MSVQNESTLKVSERFGLGVVSPGAGIGVVEMLLRTDPLCVDVRQVRVANPFVWATFLNQLGNPGVFNEFEVVKASQAPVPNNTTAERSRRKKQKRGTVAAVSSDEQREALQSQVFETVSGVLGLPVGADEPLMDAGLDSMSSVQLRNKLGSDLGMVLPATLVFDYPSVGALVGYLQTQMVTAGG